MYRPEDYPELNGKEPDWVASEREMFKDHRDKDGDGKLNQVCFIVCKFPSSMRYIYSQYQSFIWIFLLCSIIYCAVIDFDAIRF